MTAYPERIAPRLLLIDDDRGQLQALKAKIEEGLQGRAANIDVWQPVQGDSLRDTLIKKLEPRPTLVVTDHDLTEAGAAGLLGGSVISWCRAHAIPVGDYSDKHADDLEEPDLFEFRFPAEPAAAAVKIVELFTGFAQLADLLGKRTPGAADGWSNTLASILAHEEAASAFSLYSVRAGASHGTAIKRLQTTFGEEEARRLLEIYVIGHLLYNGILRYPGPIMAEPVLCSYLAISDERAEEAGVIFEQARYSGPFGTIARYYWQEAVDDRLLELADARNLSGDLGDDVFRRQIMATMLTPGEHPCKHCAGDRGGFRCPYTHRTTCDRSDCSVPTTSWIPRGAHLCRVDRDYYDQWSPLLGF